MSRTVFVDRDGVIIEDGDYIHRVEDLRIIPGAVEGLKNLFAAGFQIIIVTNQAGIARGFYTEEEYHAFSNQLLAILEKDGVRILAVYFCPHHPTEGVGKYKIDCACRKPRTGMLRRAASEHKIEASSSWLIGDKTSDIQAGKDFGLKTILVRTGYGGKDGQCASEPDYVAVDMLEAACLILKKEP